MHPVPSCNNALFHLYGHGYKYSKYLFKHRASDDDDDDDDDGSCTYESNSSSDSSSEVESGTDIRSDESFVSDDLTIRYIYMSTYTHVSVSDSSGLVYFTVGRVEFIQHLNNNRQENFWQNFFGGIYFIHHFCQNFWGLFKIISGLVHSVYSLEGKMEN